MVEPRLLPALAQAVSPEATVVPPEVVKARAAAFLYVLRKGWLTGAQIKEAEGFGAQNVRWNAARERRRDR